MVNTWLLAFLDTHKGHKWSVVTSQWPGWITIREKAMLLTITWTPRANVQVGFGFAFLKVGYFLNLVTLCAAGARGSCPDDNLALGRDNVKLLNSAIINEFTMLTFRRPLQKDDQFDSAILTNQSQAVIWAMGPINNRGEVSKHLKRNKDTMLLDFGRIPQWNCPIAGNKPRNKNVPSKEPQQAPRIAQPWFVPPIQVRNIIVD